MSNDEPQEHPTINTVYDSLFSAMYDLNRAKNLVRLAEEQLKAAFDSARIAIQDVHPHDDALLQKVFELETSLRGVSFWTDDAIVLSTQVQSVISSIATFLGGIDFTVGASNV